MRIFLGGLSLVLSILLYVWFAAIFLWPVYLLGWSEGWRLAINHRQWSDWAAIAGIVIGATALLVGGVSLMDRRRPPHA